MKIQQTRPWALVFLVAASQGCTAPAQPSFVPSATTLLPSNATAGTQQPTTSPPHQVKLSTKTKDESHWCVNEAALNNRAYDALDAGHTDQAIAYFRINVALYPRSANVYDGLGEAYEKKGFVNKARQSYRRAVQLHPVHSHAKQALANLELVSVPRSPR